MKAGPVADMLTRHVHGDVSAIYCGRCAETGIYPGDRVRASSTFAGMGWTTTGRWPLCPACTNEHKGEA